MIDKIINVALYLSVFIFALFNLIISLYALIGNSRKKRKHKILKYAVKQANEWGEKFNYNKDFDMEDLYSPAKMNNAGIGNNASNLNVKNYSTYAQWFLRM